MIVTPVAFVDGVLEFNPIALRVVACLPDMFAKRSVGDYLVFASFTQVRTGFIELGQHLLAPGGATGRATRLKHSIFDELLTEIRAHGSALRKGPSIVEATALDRLPDHDRFSFLRNFLRHVQHYEVQNLVAPGQLDVNSAIGRNEESKQSEVVNRGVLALYDIVLHLERIVLPTHVG